MNKNYFEIDDFKPLFQFIHSFLERKNLKLEVKRQTTFLEDVCPILRTIKCERAVIYVLRRCDVDSYATQLRETLQIECTTYHSANSKTSRTESLCSFIEKKVQVIIATNALSAQKVSNIQVVEMM
jgi:superfamily II DNA helicase RecQ